ncbi:Uncharacterised protein [uncultured archaeon]|nr:Uncharacterised protein [uncultured archaeon]
MYLKVHSSPNGVVVALCDAELVGRVFSEGERTLDLSRHADFYEGEKVGEQEAIDALRGAEHANITGKKSLAAAKKAGLPVAGAIKIATVPHLQIYRF